jgi:voltage-gated potassium channel Kch
MTQGFGNLVPRTNTGRTFIVFFALLGIEIASATITMVSSVQLLGIDSGLTRLMLPKDASDDDKKQLAKRPKFRAARILLNFFVMSLFFAAIPSVIFTKMEGWSYSTALYFTFVTMTTVGFGDYVAGKRVS